MRPPDGSMSPKFASFEPFIVDSDMENVDDDGDLRCFDPSVLQISTSNTSNEFEDLFFRPSSASQMSDAMSCLSNLTSKVTANVPPNVPESTLSPPDTRSESPENSSNASSANSPLGHGRKTSLISNPSEAFSPGSIGPDHFLPTPWPNSEVFSLAGGSFVKQDGSSLSLKGEYAADIDIEMSNKAMDSAFDFDSAASSPSPLATEAASERNRRPEWPKGTLHNSSSSTKSNSEPASTHPAGPHSTFSKPVNGFKYWNGVCPTELGGMFGNINMNGTSPLNATLSPSLNFKAYPSPFKTAGFHPAVVFPMSDANAIFHPAFGFESYICPRLIVHPTALKSRVETQIPIKLTLYPMPPGVKRLRLPSYTISKPKFFAKSDTPRSPDIFELSVSVVCTSAMQDNKKRERAFARARGEQLSPKSPPKEDISEEARDDEDNPLKGAEVKICAGCIQRERKRASRKKQRKPEEDEMFQKDEDKRVVVFNTTEIKDWVDPPRITSASGAEASTPAPPLGSMQVELPMRIACYCRHQGEKMGFQVIFTIKDYLGNVIAQEMTNSIMITDDHKTHTPSCQTPANSVPPESQAPIGRAFTPKGPVDLGKQFIHQAPFKLSHSATDLQALRKQQYPLTPGPFVQPQASSGTDSTSTPRGVARQAPSKDLHCPLPKRRKQNGPSKIPGGLTMTKVEAPPNKAVPKPKAAPPESSSKRLATPPQGQSEQLFVMPSSMVTQFGNGPPTPITTDSTFFSVRDRPQNLENFPQQSLSSAPNSAQTSRPGTPGGPSRHGPQDQAVNGGPNPVLQPQMWNIPPNPPQQMPPMIHKLVPAEGSTTGGSEVTLLGSGFFPGMEVVFGDTLATTTTFWGDKCLNCLTPPALQPGTVSVVFKHEHPRFGQVQQTQPVIPKQQTFFRYVDDRELQMYRVALGILGQKLRNPADAYQTAQQIMGGDPNTLWNIQNGFQNGQQRGGNTMSQNGTMAELDAKMLIYLEFMDLDDTPGVPRFNLRSPAGQTLLHFASSLGLTRFVAGLLARGANPDVQDNNGNTPMHLAAISGHTHIVHRLRLSGADVGARNLRDFAPADLASSLEVHQAVLIPSRHYRSRSVGSTPSLRRRLSSVSLDEFWDTSSSGEFMDAAVDPSGTSDDDATESNSDVMVTDSVFYQPHSRQASAVPQNQPGYYIATPCENIAQPPEVVPPTDSEPHIEVGRGFSPPAALLAWRNQLAAQINQFQQSVNRAFPNLPALPPMPTLPDYQTHPMIQRISSLVPHRPTTSWSTNIMKDSWDRLTGNSSPPAYEELYPGENSHDDHEVKKSSMVEAALDAAVDQHFEEQSKLSSATSADVKEDIGDVRIGRKTISRQQQEQLRKAHALKMKRIRSDRNLFFIWIPLLIVVMFAMLQNIFPGFWHGVAQGYQFLKTRYVTGHVEAIPS
ncbi:SPT3 Dosage dependent suppressor of Ty-induced promoter mutations-like protein [Emydomyces testavorans]|uniref:SPT3 Dosage dependent suppressor of Ty-induced promoter mutations-like protein n=1 Tax=Emydomyces testavorans TaxID=2070801 RepID=A0AAF0IGM1_9EURO|nr:SPT3 Dosage dependent suppressor of Ty-induced promoter mutations-like protein [Emydomyces testavorans]